MARPPRRERALITKDGFILVQDDPHEDPVAIVVVEDKDGRETRFAYESTIILHDDVGPTFTMTTYVEEPENGTDPLEGAS